MLQRQGIRRSPRGCVPARSEESAWVRRMLWSAGRLLRRMLTRIASSPLIYGTTRHRTLARLLAQLVAAPLGSALSAVSWRHELLSGSREAVGVLAN